jgi:hypothetical protein
MPDLNFGKKDLEPSIAEVLGDDTFAMTLRPQGMPLGPWNRAGFAPFGAIRDPIEHASHDAIDLKAGHGRQQ